MPAFRLRGRAVRSCVLGAVLVATALAYAAGARAEKIIYKDGDWEAYTEGRVGGFFSWTFGDGFPQNTYYYAPDGTSTVLWDASGGGFLTGPLTETDPTTPPEQPDQGTFNNMRVRSGFISNVIALGARNHITPDLTASGFFQIWAYIESESRQKNRPNPADVRQGYGKLEAPWGSLIVGRTRCLFSRGATDINVMYAHKWGLGFPGSLDSNGPTAGMIGFGVLGSGFAAGIVYATPVLGGFQASVGAFEPITLPAAGAWNRTRYLRPEAELTFEQPFGDTSKVFFFVNGGYQSVYQGGLCPPDPTDPNPLPCKETAYGTGYGARFEVGPVHLGVAGHWGKGLGLKYALEASPAAQDQQGAMRKNDGYYVQTQFVFSPIDVFAGAGIARVFQTDYDKETTVADPRDPTGMAQIYPHSIIKYQMGINAGVVYHAADSLHFDVDGFRATAKWYLGEEQVVHAVNAGMTFNW